MTTTLIPDAFAIEEYTAAAPLELGPLRARLREVPHFVTTHAIELCAPSGARLTFSADCRPNEALVDLARDTDLLLIEATATSPAPRGQGGHLTAREAGEHGAAAGARRLVLTHFSDELDPRRIGADGAEGFGAAVELAREGAVFTV